MDLKRLREETRPEHEATESTLPLTAPGLTRAGYAQALRTMLPIVESWERWAAAHTPVRLRGLLEARRRSHLLRADLRSLGVPVRESEGKAGAAGGDEYGRGVNWADVVRGGHVRSTEGEHGAGDGEATALAFEAEFLGALYVMEGSTLGGRYIARHVEETLGLLPGEGNAYFQGHGEKTGSMWREVTAVLGEVPDDLAPEVIAAAKRAFHAFGEELSREQARAAK